MEHISNKEKAKEIAKKLSHPNIDSFGDGDDEFDTRFYHTNKDAALQAMQWKDEQFAKEKQQWIDKAWNWLTSQKGERTIDDFKKAMEE